MALLVCCCCCCCGLPMPERVGEVGGGRGELEATAAEGAREADDASPGAMMVLARRLRRAAICRGEEESG